MKLIRAITLISLLFPALVLASEQYVVKDGNIGLTLDEVEYLVTLWTPDMREAAARDVGDRMELLNMALASKKLAALADTISPEDDPQAYWKQVFTIRNIKSRYVVDHYMSTIEVPDMSALAEERYETQKDKYALAPEERLSSHILLLCEPGGCDRDARRVEAQKILDEVNAGGDFAELATKYSEDPGSKERGGRFNQWLKLGQPHVDPHFVGAVFAIEEAGGHSGIVDTRFGLHIIRVDEIRPAYYKSFEEVRENIIAALRNDYIKLSAKKFDAGFRFTDNVSIDNAAIEEVLSTYEESASAAE